jgi:ribosomal RNA-processing protein 8
MIIADFGCGEAKLAQSLNQKVHSFDFVALNDLVIQCDMKNVPLNNSSCDLVVFCLSLMGTNLNEFISEAHRVLKTK